MRNSTAAYLALVAALSVPGLGLAASSKPAGAAQAKATVPGAARRYLPEYAPNGDLLLPRNFERWVFVGSPLTPNALNGGKANFPEFHNVYIEPGSYEI